MQEEVGLYVFARFRARPGCEARVENVMQAMLAPTREEPGCLSINIFRSTVDERLFFVHSRWKDEDAFDLHARFSHTLHFLSEVEPLIDHALEITRTRLIA